MSKNNSDKTSEIYNEFSFTDFSSLIKQNEDRMEFEINQKYGEGKQIIYKIFDGFYAEFSDYTCGAITGVDNNSFSSDMVVMYQILDGKAMINLKNNKTILLKKGDIIQYVGKAEFTECLGFDCNLVTVGVFGYYAKLLDSLRKTGVDTAFLELYYDDIKQNKDVIVYSKSIKFSGLVRDVHLLLQKNDDFLLKIKASELLHCGIGNYKKYKPKEKPKFDTVYIEKVFEIKEYLDKNFTSSPTLHQLAGRFGLNVTYLKEIFKECFNIQPHRYIILKRLEESKKVLSETNLKVNDVAMSLGFASSSKFSQAFKQKYGCSPMQFRKDVQEKQRI